MSHVAKYKTQLGIVNKTIFETALKAALQDYIAANGGSLTETVSEGRYQQTKVIAGVKNQAFPDGVGFSYNEKNEVNVVVRYQQETDPKTKEVEKIVQQYYMLICTELALKKRGYQVRRVRNSDGSWNLVGTQEEAMEAV